MAQNGTIWYGFELRRNPLAHTLRQVNESKDVVYNNITINAKSTSSNAAKNTDGWNIYCSDSVTITNSVINNGDDCVAFKPSKLINSLLGYIILITEDATNVLVANLSCTGSQ